MQLQIKDSLLFLNFDILFEKKNFIEKEVFTIDFHNFLSFYFSDKVIHR